MKSILLATVTVSTFAMPALAAPKVAVDILPVHSLVSRVMEGVATPTLVVPPGASPHGYAMRPSEAAALQDADVVFFIGEALSPQIARSIESLAGDATRISLLEVPDIVRLEFREGATFEAHDHSAHGDDHDDHDHGEHASHDDHDHEAEKAHDDHGEHEHASHDDHDHAAEKAHDDHGEHEHASHDDHDHAAEKAHDDHGEHEHASHDDHDHAAEKAHDDHGEHEHASHDDHDHAAEKAHDDHGEHEHASHDDHGHDHGGVDPHAWLDPQNAKVWVDAIAAALSQADPENASTYFGNAAAAKGEFDTLIEEVSATVAPIRGRGFVVFHDAYHYFEERFDVEASGAIALGDAAQPSAARVAQIKDAIGDMGAACVFAEPQFEPRLVDTVIEGTDAKKGVLDPLGADIPPGPTFYTTLIGNLADGLVDCLGQES